METTSYTINLDSPASYRIGLTSPKINTVELTSPIATGSSAKITVNTVENWAAKTSYIPKKGEIIVYSDRAVIDGVCYPGVKIGDGMAYAVDLPFVGDDIADRITTVLNSHINNGDIHVTLAEKTYWNNKLDCEVSDDNLILAPALF